MIAKNNARKLLTLSWSDVVFAAVGIIYFALRPAKPASAQASWW